MAGKSRAGFAVAMYQAAHQGCAWITKTSCPVLIACLKRWLFIPKMLLAWLSTTHVTESMYSRSDVNGFIPPSLKISPMAAGEILHGQDKCQSPVIATNVRVR